MPLIDTTNTVDTSMYLKANLANNMVGDNWYLYNLQEKRNQDWDYRYNVVDIEEELHKQINYTTEVPCYTPIQAVIQTVKNDRGKSLGDDWASLVFKDLRHPNALGYRYRFDYDYQGEGMQKLSSMSEEEKYYNTSIWLAVNKSGISPGNTLVVRRCNTSIALVGSPTRNYNNITEVRYEPGILENELKMINIYYNQTTVIPQAEWYLTMQLNYFSNFIEINDRIILGGVDVEDESNNTLFKVKAIVKANSTRTFTDFGSMDLKNIPLITLGLDRDLADSDDDFYKRIASKSPIYPVVEISEKDNTPEGDYIVSMLTYNKDNNDLRSTEKGYNESLNSYKILLGQIIKRTMVLENAEQQVFNDFEFSLNLPGISEDEYMEYFRFEPIKDKNGILNSFSLKNLKQYDEDYLILTCESKLNGKIFKKEFRFDLGGFY